MMKSIPTTEIGRMMCGAEAAQVRLQAHSFTLAGETAISPVLG
jgi:hypothetical protein